MISPSRPDEWPKWKKRFQQYRSASGLDAESEPRQVDTLLYCLGEEADSVLSSTNISSANRKKYDRVMEKFDGYFEVRRNIIFERARFNRRSQKDGESVEQYITELYNLVEFCAYGGLKEEMIRDRLVVGIRDQALSEKLQTDPGLTLEKAKTQIRQKAAVKEHTGELRKDEAAAALARIQSNQKLKPPKFKGSPASRPQSSRGGAYKHRSKEPQCTRCGRDKHQPGDRCPAMGITCNKCNKVGHFGAHCFWWKKQQAGTVSTVEEGAEEESYFLGSVSVNEASSWSVDIRIKQRVVSVKMDTGAEVTATSGETHKLLGSPQLNKPEKVLYGPAHQALNVLGQFSGWLKHGKRSAREMVYVVQGLKTNLLGLRSITALQLVRRVHATNTGEPDVVKQFPEVFQGLGTIGDEYTIKLKENATPYSLYVPRNVPIPLQPKVKEELVRMERIGVTSKVTEPTPWCAGMVVVPKKSGEVRICVDLKPLNENVLREPHPIPKVDETLASLAGATHFSKLDANSGFWQIPLSEESRPLTTFITPFGRYQFNKLPLGYPVPQNCSNAE